jgi:O-antigen/teichoic acid export membrane protein
MLPHFFSTMIIRVFFVLSTFVINAIAGRYLSVADFGEFMQFSSLIFLFGNLSVFGNDVNGIHELQENRLNETGSEARTVCARLAFAFGASVLFSGCLCLAWVCYPDVARSIFTHATNLLLFPSIILFACISLVARLYRSTHRHFIATFFDHGVVRILFLMGAGSLALTNTFNYDSLAVTYLLSMMFSCFAFFTVPLASGFDFRGVTAAAFWNSLKTGFPIAVHSMVILLNTEVLFVFVGFFSTPEERALFAAVFRLAGLVAFIQTILNTVSVSYFSEWLLRGDHARSAGFYLKSNRIVAAMGAVVALALIGSSNWLPGMLYGKEFYNRASDILCILTLFNLSWLVIGNPEVPLFMVQRSSIVRCAVLYSITFIALGSLVGSLYGFWGLLLLLPTLFLAYRGLLVLYLRHAWLGRQGLISASETP